jgi:hypothetical protein
VPGTGSSDGRKAGSWQLAARQPSSVFKSLTASPLKNDRSTTVTKMVLLTMTHSIVEAIKILDEKNEPGDPQENKGSTEEISNEDPALQDPAVGNPISHGQIIGVWNRCKARGNAIYTLEKLLLGAKVHVPPPPPKPEPVCHTRALFSFPRSGQKLT